MWKGLVSTFALAGGLLAVAPASAMPVAGNLGAQAGSGVTQVAMYCNNRGVCVRAPRAGYFYRATPSVAYRAPVGVYRAPARRTTVVHSGPNRTVKKTTTVRRNGSVVQRKVVKKN